MEVLSEVNGRTLSGQMSHSARENGAFIPLRGGTSSFMLFFIHLLTQRLSQERHERKCKNRNKNHGRERYINVLREYYGDYTVNKAHVQQELVSST